MIHHFFRNMSQEHHREIRLRRQDPTRTTLVLAVYSKGLVAKPFTPKYKVIPQVSGQLTVEQSGQSVRGRRLDGPAEELKQQLLGAATPGEVLRLVRDRRPEFGLLHISTAFHRLAKASLLHLNNIFNLSALLVSP